MEVRFEVEKVVDKRIWNGALQYFIKWKNFNVADNSWEPLENLEGSEDIIAAFEAKYTPKVSAGKRRPKKNVFLSPVIPRQTSEKPSPKGGEKEGRGYVRVYSLMNKVVKAPVGGLPGHTYYFILNFDAETDTCTLGAMYQAGVFGRGTREDRPRWKVVSEAEASPELVVPALEVEVVTSFPVNKITDIEKESWDIDERIPCVQYKQQPSPTQTPSKKFPSSPVPSPTSGKKSSSYVQRYRPKGGAKAMRANKAVTILGLGHQGIPGAGGMWYVLRHDPDEDWARVVSMSQHGNFDPKSKWNGKSKWKVDPEALAVELQVPSAACSILRGLPVAKHDDVEKENWVFQEELPEQTGEILEGDTTIGPMIRFGNTHEALKVTIPLTVEDLQSEEHRWALYIRGEKGETEGPALSMIDKVIFHLHESFNPPSVEVSQAPFEIEEVGWGVFDVKAEIHLKTGGVIRTQHSLCFDGDGSVGTALVPVGMDWSVQQGLGLVGPCNTDE